MERINMFTLQGCSTDVIIDCNTMVFSATTVGGRWNCDATWFNYYLEDGQFQNRWKS